LYYSQRHPHHRYLHSYPTRRSSDLTIIGFSVNDTIVAYDRLRENRSKFVPKGKTFAEQMNDAVNQTLSRTVLTSLTVFLSAAILDRKSTRLNSSHQIISYAVFCLKK